MASKAQRKEFGILLKHQGEILNQILALEAGIRAAYLVDFAIFSLDLLSRYVVDLSKKHNISSYLRVLKIGQFLFIVNHSTLRAKMHKDIESNFSTIKFIDISPKLEEPRLCTEVVLEHLLSKMQTQTKALLSLLDSTEEGPLEITDVHVPYLPCIVGWLLEFPFIYYDSSFNSEDPVYSNCLWMVPLHLYKVMASKGHKEEMFEVFSFSVPAKLNPLKTEDPIIQLFRQRIESAIKSSKDILLEIDITLQQVTLPHVIL